MKQINSINLQVIRRNRKNTKRKQKKYTLIPIKNFKKYIFLQLCDFILNFAGVNNE